MDVNATLEFLLIMQTGPLAVQYETTVWHQFGFVVSYQVPLAYPIIF
jgi:hypothetical protein